METNVESLEGNRVKLTVTIPAEKVEEEIAAAYAKCALDVRAPGFRKGRAPRPVLDNVVGKQEILASAMQNLVEESYPLALDAEKLRPVDEPEMEEIDGLVEGEPFVFVAEIAVRPELTLTSIDGLKIEIPPATASEADIDAEIEKMRDRFSTLEVVEDRGIQEADFVLMSFEGLVDGVAYDGNTVDKYLYELSQGQMPKEFDEGLIGAKSGDDVKIVFTIPETSSNPDFVGKEASFDITIHEVKEKVLPPLDEDFAANAGGFDTMEQVRDDLRKKLDEGMAFTQIQTKERKSLEALAERLEGEIPEIMIGTLTDRMVRQFFNDLQQRGVSLQDYVNASGIDPEQVHKDIQLEAAKRVSHQLAMEALFRHLDLEITEEDLDSELVEIAASAEKTAEQLRSEWEAAGLMSVLHEEVMHRKAVEWLMDNVEMTEVTEEDAAAAKKKTKKKSVKTEKPADAEGPAEAEKKPRARARKKKTEE